MSLPQIVAARVHARLPSSVSVVAAEPFDFGNFLGVAVTLRASGRRHAVRVKIEDGDITKAADEATAALLDWLGTLT